MKIAPVFETSLTSRLLVIYRTAFLSEGFLFIPRGTHGSAMNLTLTVMR